MGKNALFHQYVTDTQDFRHARGKSKLGQLGCAQFLQDFEIFRASLPLAWRKGRNFQTVPCSSTFLLKLLN